MQLQVIGGDMGQMFNNRYLHRKIQRRAPGKGERGDARQEN